MCAGLRDNIRALGEYAVQNGVQTESAAAELVKGVFRSFDAFDRVLDAAIRDKEATFDVAASEVKVNEAIKALDGLLATVPNDILEKSRAVLKKASLKSNMVDGPVSEDDKVLKLLLSSQELN